MTESDRQDLGGLGSGGSFHDRLAQVARQDGNTPDQFREAAQKHATAFWMWAIVAGALFVVADYWALIPAVIALLKAAQSVSSTRVARRLEVDPVPATRKEEMAAEPVDTRDDVDADANHDLQDDPGPEGPEEERILISPGGNEGKVMVTHVGPGRYRIQDLFGYVLWADDDFLEEAGVGSIVHVDELDDGRLRVKEVRPDPRLETFDGIALPGGFPQSEQFQRLADTVMRLGGNWELVFGGILSVQVPRRAAEAESFDFSTELDRALDAWRSAE